MEKQRQSFERGPKASKGITIMCLANDNEFPDVQEGIVFEEKYVGALHLGCIETSRMLIEKFVLLASGGNISVCCRGGA